MADYPSWLTGLLARNSHEVLAAVHRLTAEIDRRGWTSANDIDSSTFHQKNAVGGAFKILRSLGCVPIGYTQTTEPRKHGRLIRKWGQPVIQNEAERSKLRQFRDASRGVLVQVQDDGQQVMAI